MYLTKVFRKHFSADICKKIKTANYTFEILIKNSSACSLGNIRRPFVFKVNKQNRTRHLFYSNIPYMEVNLEKWQPAPQDNSLIFIPEFGRMSLIRCSNLERLSLFDPNLKGCFMGNIFYENYLLIIFTQSMMIVNTQSMELKCRSFDFTLSNVGMTDENKLLLEKEDGTNVQFDLCLMIMVV